MFMLLNGFVTIALLINFMLSKDFNYLYGAGIFAVASSIGTITYILEKISDTLKILKTKNLLSDIEKIILDNKNQNF